MNTRNIIQTNKKWKRKNVDWTKYKEEIGKARSITGRSKEEKMNNIYKVLRWAGERSVGYTKGIRKNNYRPWWNKEIKQKRKARREANRKKKTTREKERNGKRTDHERNNKSKELMPKEKGRSTKRDK